MMFIKRGFVVIGFFCILLSLVNFNAAAITGAAASQEQGVAVYVLPSNPLLRIDSPNLTQYNEGDFILLDYTAILIDTVWYNLDNGTNITINSSFYFQASPGVHTLYLYGNLSNGTILSDSVTFTVVAEEKDSTPGSDKIIIDELIPVRVEKEIINVSLRQGETKSIRLLVVNEFYREVRVDISRIGLENLLTSISETEFFLEVNESKEIILAFIAPEDIDPNVYIGKIFANTKTSSREILLSVEVESEEYLFDVILDIPKDPNVFKAGEEIISSLNFFNLGAGQVDVDVEYLILNEEGEIVFGEKQVLIIGTSISLTKSFKLPDNLDDGNYLFYVKVNYDDKTASASRWFVIETKTELQKMFENAFSAFTGFIKKWWRLMIEILIGLLALYLLYRFIWWFLFGKKRRSEEKKKYAVAKKSKKTKRKGYSSLLRAVTEREHKRVYK